jgi:predicted DNA-binding WGR domain protein
MSNWTVHLEFAEGTSSKFWRARLEDRTLHINYGKVGTAGQTQVKDFGTADVAATEYDKLVSEKRRKGYIDAGSGAGSGVDADDVNDDVYDDDVDDEDNVAITAAPPLGAVRLVLDTGGRKVETHIYVDGTKVHMDSTEAYASAEAAKNAHDSLRKMLIAQGYKER